MLRSRPRNLLALCRQVEVDHPRTGVEALQLLCKGERAVARSAARVENAQVALAPDVDAALECLLRYQHLRINATLDMRSRGRGRASRYSLGYILARSHELIRCTSPFSLAG